MTSHKSVVTVIVLTWNSDSFIVGCLQSILSSTYKVRVLVVDNNSSDDTRRTVSRRFPSINLINSGFNSGYAAGNNMGIMAALKEESDYVFILNPDAIIAPDTIERLVKRLDEDVTLASVSPLIYFHGTRKVWYGGARMKWRTGERIQTFQQDIGQYKNMRYTDFMSGCAVLVRGDAVNKVGLMDERYFLYCEETDWSLNFIKHGYRIGIEPEAYAWHQASSSTGGFYSPLTQYYINRNRLLFVQKNRPGLLPVVLLSSVYTNAFRLICIVREFGVGLAWSCFKSMIRAYFDFAFRRFGRRFTPQ